jgi:hypothetical protein
MTGALEKSRCICVRCLPGRTCPGTSCLHAQAIVNGQSGCTYFSPLGRCNPRSIWCSNGGFALWAVQIRRLFFTGREPNENRYDFDKPGFDSWSGRLSYNPSENWALQASHGFIKSPELLHPVEDVNRTTASAIYSKALTPGSSLNATAVWGMNKIKDHKGENAVLVEGEWRKNKLSIHSRYE